MTLSPNVADEKSVAWILAPIMAVVFIGFIITGVAMPALPLHVHDDLGLGTLVVGLVSGNQFLASLLTRIWAGDYSDRRGSKRAVVLGLAAAAGALYLISLPFVEQPLVSAVILVIGRGVLGGRRKPHSYGRGRMGIDDGRPAPLRKGNCLGRNSNVWRVRDWCSHWRSPLFVHGLCLNCHSHDLSSDFGFAGRCSSVSGRRTYVGLRIETRVDRRRMVARARLCIQQRWLRCHHNVFCPTVRRPELVQWLAGSHIFCCSSSNIASIGRSSGRQAWRCSDSLDLGSR